MGLILQNASVNRGNRLQLITQSRQGAKIAVHEVLAPGAHVYEIKAEWAEDNRGGHCG